VISYQVKQRKIQAIATFSKYHKDNTKP